MRTVSHFHTPNIVKRYHTVGSQLGLRTDEKQQKMKARIRNVISMTSNHNWSHIESESHQTSTKLQKINITPRITDQYDQKSENLTTQFITQWSNMDAKKKQTYFKLRNKFVQKYPSFRQKYKNDDMSETYQQINQTKTQQGDRVYTQPPIQIKIEQTQKNEDSMQKSFIRSSIRQSNIKVKPYNPLKKAYFYSKSKKKCLQNNVQVSQPTELVKTNRLDQIPVPKITYLSYIKDHRQKQKLKRNKIKGQQMIRTREKILQLQKQGTYSHSSLKKCLQDAIQMCVIKR